MATVGPTGRCPIVVPHLDEWIGSLFEPDEIDRSCAALSAAATLRRRPAGASRPTPRDRGLRPQARPVPGIIDRDGDIVAVTKWIIETERRKNSAQAQLTYQRARGEPSPDEIKQFLADPDDIVDVLRKAVPQQKAETYRELRVSLRYDHSSNAVAQLRRSSQQQVDWRRLACGSFWVKVGRRSRSTAHRLPTPTVPTQVDRRCQRRAARQGARTRETNSTRPAVACCRR